MSRPDSGANSGKPELYTLRIKKSAERAIDAFTDDEKDLIDEALQSLAQSPRPGNSKKIAGHPPLRRLKIPPFRIFYVLDDKDRTILILHIEKRTGNTYKNLDRLVVGLKPPPNAAKAKKTPKDKPWP